ncbi:MAG TPA: hypothetical protein DCE42_15340, partial [Myxococcales bacterium]|nr:hypothetical protein [Myxococcales bacterium]
GNAARKLLSDIIAKAPKWGETGKTRMLSIILDGENAWENYTQDHDATRFFMFFYRLLQDGHKYKEILTVTPSEFIDGNAARGIPAHPTSAQQELEPLNAGSWIDGTFRIWIGEDEETCGWDYLARAKADLVRAERLWNVTRPNPLAAPIQPGAPGYNAFMAWESLYAAQGSDWFWWFGDDMTSPANDDSGFDNGFRALLTAVYTFANKAGAKLTLPVFRPCVQAKPKPVPTAPCSQCPKVDGKFDPDDSEWTTDGGYMKDSDSADPNQPSNNDQIASVYFAFDTTNLFIGLLSNFDLSAKLGKDYKVYVYFSHRHIIDIKTGKVSDDKPINTQTPSGTKLEMKVGGAARRLMLDFSGSKVVATLQKADGQGGWTNQTSGVKVAGPASKGMLVEASVPWKDLNLTVNATLRDPLEVLVVAEENKQEIDRAPNFGVFTVFEDASDAVYVTFEVDISNKSDWGKYKTCCKEKPKPDGPASVFIVGNHRKLGMVGVDAQGKPIWIPNKIQMNQDPNNQWLWTLTVALPKGMKVNYKYTIGTNSDEGRWQGTEEFPVTFRGFTAEDTTGNRCIRIRDYWANKPSGGLDGNIGSKSNLNVGCK